MFVTFCFLIITWNIYNPDLHSSPSQTLATSPFLSALFSNVCLLQLLPIMTSLNDRIDTIQKEMMSLQRETQKDKAAREKLLGVCQRAMGIVATPTEQIRQMVMQPHINAAIRSCMEIGLFDMLNKSERPVNADEMAKTTGADKILIVRLLRPLGAIHIVIETGYETWVAGPVCKALDTPSLKGLWMFEYGFPPPFLATFPRPVSPSLALAPQNILKFPNIGTMMAHWLAASSTPFSKTPISKTLRILPMEIGRPRTRRTSPCFRT